MNENHRAMACQLSSSSGGACCCMQAAAAGCAHALRMRLKSNAGGMPHAYNLTVHGTQLTAPVCFNSIAPILIRPKPGCAGSAAKPAAVQRWCLTLKTCTVCSYISVGAVSRGWLSATTAMHRASDNQHVRARHWAPPLSPGCMGQKCCCMLHSYTYDSHYMPGTYVCGLRTHGPVGRP